MVNKEKPPVTVDAMQRLKSLERQTARVVYVNVRDLRVEQGELREVTPFGGVSIANPSDHPGVIERLNDLPFIAPGVAIRTIEVPPGNIVYENPNIGDSFDVWDDDAIDAARRGLYGDEVVGRYWRLKTRYTPQD